MTTWQHRAACLGDPWPFHPDRTTGDAYEAALAICRGCPVVAECLEFALAREGAGGADGRHGVWGGTTPDQRAAMVRRRQRRSRAGAAS